MLQLFNNFISILIIITLFVVYYLVLSLIPLLFGQNYFEVVSNQIWGVMYSFFIGWWVVWVTVDKDIKL